MQVAMVEAVTTLLLHAPDLLTLREIVDLNFTCREWRHVITKQLPKRFEAAIIMYQFLAALLRCPRNPFQVQGKAKQQIAYFVEQDWHPFLRVLNYQLTPLQLALYYAYCYWAVTERSKSCLSTLGAQHVTLLLYPSGLVKEMRTENPAPCSPPYIHFKNNWHECTMDADFAECSVSAEDVDTWLLAAAATLERRVFQLAEAGQLSDRDMSVLSYAMAEWQLDDIKPAITYTCAEGEDEGCIEQKLSRYLPLATGNLIIQSINLY